MTATPQVDVCEQALAIVERYGVSLFPVGRNKRPIYPGDHLDFGRGFHAATTDPERVRRMFSHPDAMLIGVPAGPDNDLLVIDFDTPRYVGTPEEAKHKAFLEEHDEAIRRTARIVRTPSGGLHIHWRWPQGVDRLPGRLMTGVDVQGKGAYVVFPTEAPPPGNEALWYRVEHEPEVVCEPPAAVLEALINAERVARSDFTGSGASMMTEEQALAALSKNADRHPAMMSLAWHAARRVVEADTGLEGLLAEADGLRRVIRDAMVSGGAHEGRRS